MSTRPALFDRIRGGFTVVLTLLALVLVPGLGHAQQKPAEKPAMAAKAPAGKTAPVDINSATEAELQALPGIGDAYAKKIVAGRPYAKKDQLLSRKILPKATYDKIKGQLVAKQPKK